MVCKYKRMTLDHAKGLRRKRSLIIARIDVLYGRVICNNKNNQGMEVEIGHLRPFLSTAEHPEHDNCTELITGQCSF